MRVLYFISCLSTITYHCGCSVVLVSSVDRPTFEGCSIANNFYMKSVKSAIDDLIPLDVSLLVNVCKSSSLYITILHIGMSVHISN